MARQRSPALDYLVYVAVRLVVCFVQMLTMDAALRLGRSLAWLLYKVDRAHRLVADENLRLACAELADDPARWDRLVRSVYEHFCTMHLLMVQLPRRYHIYAWRRYLDMDHGGQLVAALLSGRRSWSRGTSATGGLHARRVRLPQLRHREADRQPHLDR